MKISILYTIFASILLFSCSKNEEVTTRPTIGDDIPTIYQPIKIANYWNYETENRAVLPTPAEAIIANDKLVVDSEVVLNTFTYKKMKTETAPTGFYGSMLNNNSLRIDGSSLKLTGSITANLDASLPLELNVNDFVIFKENGVANEVLSQTSPESFTNTTLLPGATLTFTYSLKSTYIGDVSSLTVAAGTFSSVKKTRIEIELKVTTLNNGFEVSLLAPSNQNVIISDLYYAKNIGVIQANSIFEYNLALTLPNIPQHGKQEINDYLTSYLIN